MSANYSFTTNRIKDNELSLTLDDPISQETHRTMFICGIVNQLPSGKDQTSTIEFFIRTSEVSFTIIKMNELRKDMYVAQLSR